MARSLAPSRETFEIQGEAEFEESYVAGLEEIGAERIAHLLRRISAEEGDRPLVLLCWEKNPQECHRTQFAAWWQQRTGQRIEELRPGQVESPAEQGKLFE
jgi:hypothetical protein